MDLDGGMALSVAGLWLDAQIDVDIEDIGYLSKALQAVTRGQPISVKDYSVNTTRCGPSAT